MDTSTRTTLGLLARVVVAAAVIALAGFVAMSMEDDALAAGLTTFALIPTLGLVVGTVDGRFGHLRAPYAAWLVVAVLAAAVQQVVQSITDGLRHGGTTAGTVVSDAVMLVPLVAALLYVGVAIGLLLGHDLASRHRDATQA